VKGAEAEKDTVGWMAPLRLWGIDDRIISETPISVGHVVLGPSQKVDAHYHPFVSLFYQLRGGGRAYYGKALDTFVDAEPDDLVYIPAKLVHRLVNPVADLGRPS